MGRTGICLFCLCTLIGIFALSCSDTSGNDPGGDVAYLAPEALDLAAETHMNTAVDITLLAFNPQGYDLLFKLVDQPQYGTAQINGNRVTYMPGASYTGSDSFTYQASDGTTESNVATVTLIITNGAPVAVDLATSTLQKTTVQITLMAYDPYEDNLTYELVDLPLHGTAELIENQVSYTPAADYTGLDSFTYKANDGNTDSNLATVTIIIANVGPMAEDIAVTTFRNRPLDIPLLVFDPYENDFTFEIVSPPLNGTAGLNGSLVTYTPAEDYLGPDSFTYKANDGTSDSNVATVTITTVNVGPVAEDLAVTTFQNTPVEVELIAQAPPENNLTYELVDLPLHGTVSLNGSQVTYTPTEDYNGPDSFTYQANDGLSDSNVARVNLTVGYCAKPYLLYVELQQQGLEMVSETFSCGGAWVPMFNISYLELSLTVCNVAPNGLPKISAAEKVQFSRSGSRCNPNDKFASLQVYVKGIFEGINFLPGFFYGLDHIKAEVELEYMPVSYETGTYDQKWIVNPSFEGGQLKLFSGSGNVITNRVELEQFSADPNASMVVGLGSGLTGVFDIRATAKASRCPNSDMPEPCNNTTGHYNYYTNNIKGVGYENTDIQFEPTAYNSTSFIDTYSHCEHLQLETVADSSGGVVESNVNSNVIGVFDGMKPLLNKAKYKAEIEFEYMPVSYETGTYDQKWSVNPSLAGNSLKLFSGAGNIITNRVELEQFSEDPNTPMIAGLSSGLTGVFSLEATAKTWRCPNLEAYDPYRPLTIPCLNNPGRYNYYTNNIKGVGYENTGIQLEPASYDSTSFIDTYSHCEHLQLTTAANSSEGTAESVINCNVIGVFDGMKPLLSKAIYTAEVELEYMPVSYETGTYDQKWSVNPAADSNSLKLFSGTGNVVTNRVKLEQFSTDPNTPMVVGLGSGLTGVFSLEATAKAWRCPNLQVYDPARPLTANCTNNPGRYNYYTNNIKGVGYESVSIQFEPIAYDSTSFIDTYSYVEGIQLSTKSISREGVVESSVDSSVTGVFNGMKPLLAYVNYTANLEFQYMPISYNGGTYDQKWIIEPLDPSLVENNLKLFSGSGNMIMNVVQIIDLNPDTPNYNGYGGLKGNYTILEVSPLGPNFKCDIYGQGYANFYARYVSTP